MREFYEPPFFGPASDPGRAGPTTMTPKDLPADQRPREKLLGRGAAALTDGELLALLLRTGLPGQGVFQLAEHLLASCGGLAGLLTSSDAQLKTIKGLGPAKRAELLAVMEIARRAVAQPLRAAPVFDRPEQMKTFVSLQLGGHVREVFAVLFLDLHHRLLAWEELFQGSLSQALVHPREVVRRAMELNAAAVVLAHNHPSGVAEPSRADELLTQTLRSALALVDVRVMDHLIVGRGHVVSLSERGMM
jgi:DNA repair protein RadC